MAMSPEAFVPLLIQADAKAANLVSQHYEDNDDLLIHLLLPDVLRLCVSEFHAGDRPASDRLLALVNDALLNGDERLINAVTVSFVEHVGAGEGETPEFIATWPSGLLSLLDELTR